MIIGMDFGTTNTGAALFDGHQIQLLPLDPDGPNPAVCRTAVYMTRTGDYYLGSTALNRYFEQNVGRPTRYRKVWIGEIEQVFAELPTFYRDVYVFEDEFSPGRLFTSVKTALRNQNYYGTVFQENWYSPSDLAAIFMLGMKMQMDAWLGQEVEEIVLGRPVFFSTDPTEDKVAQSRLLDAAFKAGFRKVYLEYEPIAAALSYERELSHPEVLLVFDFGGGTLDFTVMEIGAPGRRRVLATGGIPIAGDIFDQRLFRATIPRHLGEGETFRMGGASYPIPAHIFDSLTRPEEVLSLNTPQMLDMLRQIHQGAQDRNKTRALLKVVSSNYALLMFDLVEKAKRRLSENQKAWIEMETADFSLWEPVTRKRFENAIQEEYRSIRRELLGTLERSGLQAAQIDRVIRTGGSSQIPLFTAMLNDIFGADKVRAINVFSSVTSGLAILGREIATGQAEMTAHTPETRRGSGETSHRGGDVDVRPIDLGAVLKRLEVTRAFEQGRSAVPERLLFSLQSGTLRVWPFSREEEGQTPAGEPKNLQPGVQMHAARAGQAILLATDHYKLISSAVEDLFIAQQAGPRGLETSLPLEPDEQVTAMLPWDPDHPAGDWVCLITVLGQGRAFDAALLAEQLAHKPYFQLERRYNGIPAALLLAGGEDLILVGTEGGRAACAPVREMRVQPFEIIKVRKDEIVSAARPVANGQRVLAVNEKGQTLPVNLAELPQSGPPASRGRSLRRSFRITAFVDASSLKTRFQ